MHHFQRQEFIRCISLSDEVPPLFSYFLKKQLPVQSFTVHMLLLSIYALLLTAQCLVLDLHLIG